MNATPGLVIGVGAGAVASLLALAVGQPVLTGLALAVPLGLLGAGYSLLEAHGRVRRGGFAPACLYWLVGFPLARLVQEVVTHLAFPPDVLGFLAYQAVISAGFAIGFLWLHERIRIGQHRVSRRDTREDHHTRHDDRSAGHRLCRRPTVR